MPRTFQMISLLHISGSRSENAAIAKSKAAASKLALPSTNAPSTHGVASTSAATVAPAPISAGGFTVTVIGAGGPTSPLLKYHDGVEAASGVTLVKVDSQ